MLVLTFSNDWTVETIKSSELGNVLGMGASRDSRLPSLHAAWTANFVSLSIFSNALDVSGVVDRLYRVNFGERNERLVMVLVVTGL